MRIGLENVFIVHRWVFAAVTWDFYFLYKAKRGRKNIFYISHCMCFVCELAILLLLLLPTKHIGIELRKRIGKSERKGEK